MNAYIYQAALYCEDCAKAIRERLTAAPCTTLGRETFVDGQPNEDSDRWPHGPYSDGGGEADYPQHCDACGEFLENPLTSDGVDYVREMAEGNHRGNPGVVEEWLRFYDMNG
jgi:hypothetical protein